MKVPPGSISAHQRIIAVMMPKRSRLGLLLLASTSSSFQHPTSVIRRGGSSSDADLDAYIEELIASVDDDETVPSESSINLATETNEEGANDEDGPIEVDEASQVQNPMSEELNDEASVNRESDDSQLEPSKEEDKDSPADNMERLQVQNPTAEEGNDDLDNDTGDLNDSASEQSKESVHESTVDNKQAEAPTGDEPPSVPKKQPTKKSTITRKDSTSTARKPRDLANPMPAHQSLKARRLNPILRALLRAGLTGRTLAVLLILLGDLVAKYIPPLALLLTSVLSRFFPFDPAEDHRQPKGGNRKSAKQRKEEAKQADKVAMEQLRLVGDKAKHRLISLEFVQRHGLGSFSEDNISSLLSVERGKDSDNESDWVLGALTGEARAAPGGPSVGLEVGSKGIGLGVEFSIGEGKKSPSSLVKAAIRSEAKQKKNKRQSVRLSDKDGGDGLLGRIRAATGANSIVSRSLLGAYPGDAVSPEEAGSAEGVIALARRYGWGSWEDELKSKRRKSAKKRKSELRPSAISSLSHEFDISNERKTKRTSKRSESSRRTEATTEQVESMKVHPRDHLKQPLERIREVRERLP